MQSPASPKNKISILDKQIGKPKGDVSVKSDLSPDFCQLGSTSFVRFQINLSTFALLISEMVTYCNRRTSNAADFQTK